MRIFGIAGAVFAVGTELLATSQGVYWVALASAAALALPNVVYTNKLRQAFGFTALLMARISTLRAGLISFAAPTSAGSLATDR